MYRFRAEVWVYHGEGPWHFVTLPMELSDEIKTLTAGTRRGFGSVKVKVTIGATEWSTSIFPGSDGYVLPLKRAVRDKERLGDGDSVAVGLEILDPH